MARVGGRLIALAVALAAVGSGCGQLVPPTATMTPVPTASETSVPTPSGLILLDPWATPPSYIFETDPPGPTPAISMRRNGIALRCGIADMADCAAAVDTARDALTAGYVVVEDHRRPRVAVVTSSHNCLPLASGTCTRVALWFGPGDGITFVLPFPEGGAAAAAY